MADVLTNTQSDTRLVVTLDGPLVVKKDTALFKWLKEIGQWSEVTSLRNLIVLLKSMIARDMLFDPNNVKIIVCNEKLEGILGMRYLHISQISTAILKSTFIIFDPCKLYHLLPIGTTLGNIRHHISVPKGYTEKNAEDKSLTKQTESAILDEHTNYSQFIYIVNEPLRRLLGLPSAPSTRNEVVRTFSKYVSRSKSILVDKQNLKVIIIKEDILGLIFNANTLYLGQAIDYLHKQMQYVGEEIIETNLLSNVKVETEDLDPLSH